MLCPHCAAPIGEHVTDYGDCACAACGLCAPRDVLEALAARLAPAGVLAEAERLLRERGVLESTFSYDEDWPGMRRNVYLAVRVGDDVAADSLAEAYEKVRGGQ